MPFYTDTEIHDIKYIRRKELFASVNHFSHHIISFALDREHYENRVLNNNNIFYLSVLK